jgi:hypothetical protein
VVLGWFAAGRWGVVGLIGAQAIVQAAWNNWWTVLRGIKGLREPSLGGADHGEPSRADKAAAQPSVVEKATAFNRY